MVGSGNTNPPSIALLAYAAAQAGLVLAAERPVSRLLARPRPWRLVRRLNAMVMTVYLWHFVPVIVIAVAFYPTGVMPQPAIGSAQWWELRPAWFALLAVVLVPLVLLLTWAQRPMVRLPAGLGPSGPWSLALLLLGLAASMVGLARLAIAGFAPGGRLAVPVLAACAVGLAATLFTGRARPEAAEPRALHSEMPDQPSQARAGGRRDPDEPSVGPESEQGGERDARVERDKTGQLIGPEVQQPRYGGALALCVGLSGRPGAGPWRAGPGLGRRGLASGLWAPARGS
jgi:hypothetical protein